MTGIELRALRRSLHYAAAEAAALVSLTTERTWVRWERSVRPVPDDVAGSVREIALWRDSVVEATAKRLKCQSAPKLTWPEVKSNWLGDPRLWRPYQSACAILLGRRPELIIVRGEVCVFWDGYWYSSGDNPGRVLTYGDASGRREDYTYDAAGKCTITRTGPYDGTEGSVSTYAN